MGSLRNLPVARSAWRGYEVRMTKGWIPIATIALALAPIGGAASGAGPPPNGGTISIEPSTTDGDYDAALHVFVDATAAALAARGFTVIDEPGHAAFVVELRLTRDAVGTGFARAPGQKAEVFGTGVVVPLSNGKSDLVPLWRTRLEMRLRRRGEAGIVWDGAAVTVRAADTRTGADATVAADLGQALLQSYPAEPKGVIGVP